MSQSTNLIFNGGNIPAARGQSDWAETNPQAESFIRNKPNIDKGRIHKFTRRSGTIDGETPQYTYWLVDMEKRDPNDPNEYARVSMEDLYEIVTSDEIPVFLWDNGSGNSWTHYYLSRVDFTKTGDAITLASCYFVRDESFGKATSKELVHFVSGSAPYSSQYLELGETPIPVDLLKTDGDGKDVTVTFNEASTIANIASGEELSVILGKIAKWFSSGFGFHMPNYGTVTITSPLIVVKNNGYTIIVNPSGSQEESVRVQINSVINGEFPNVELDIDNLNGNVPLSVTVRTFDGHTYSDLPPMREGTSTVPAGGILHVSVHGLGWFGTTLDTST